MNWFWDNIHLKKADRTGMFTFLGILFFILLIKYYLVVYYQPEVDIITTDVSPDVEYAEVEQQDKSVYSVPPPIHSHPKKQDTNPPSRKAAKAKKEAVNRKVFFDFDPNIISKDSLMLLGLSKYAADNIGKYRAKGGYFKEPNDIKRIYGIEEDEFNSLKPFIKINHQEPKLKIKEDRKSNWAAKKPPIALRSIDINLADTTVLKSLKGIGSVYANRIVKFRNSLGGYFAIDQVKEVWGISDSLFYSIEPYLTIDTSKIIRRNINSLVKETLVKHPYIDWKKAKIISSYKKMHGNYKSMDDFKRLHGIDASFVDTLRQYFVAQ